MPEFAWPWAFLLLPLPLLVAWLAPPAPVVAALRLPQAGLALAAQAPLRQRRWSILLLVAWALLVCAAARPQRLGAVIEPPRSGRAMLLAIDISGSMETLDMQLGGRRVSRFVATRAIVDDFISRRQGDKLGLILFGSHAYLVTPLTWDLTTVRNQFDTSAVGLAGRETALGDAIAVGVRRLEKLPDAARVLILLTDGVDNASHLAPEQAAHIAKAAGVRIYTIGVGSDGNPFGGLFGGMMATRGADLNVASLTRIARLTGGEFFRASDTDQLAQAWQRIARLEPIKQDGQPLRLREELFRWPLLAALLLAGVGLVLRRWPRFREATP